ncbi:rhodanese-related sulfurtransferase [Aphanothece hegewaldii CCALA 016]|uniref:Rhodanese-related sulfurtransferase n=1 Tax=Aphanothece hegewaldii CCALA 016 TaxID=2107694 RepID=A0A2T1LSY3_9CHRO|nr:rhodanese-like domain-containing protein [Aphanothece hegewaldii]PSF33070.1 rhodanese-related sulfurtransferase [Aphanothece hegewaldii CCALA 016]
MNQYITQISVEALGLRMAEQDPNLQLIDVREPQEVAIASIPGFLVFPLSEYEQWSQNITTQLNQGAETLVLCHHGIRSAQMCQWLQAQGFTNVKNISGGIDAYSLLVDTSVPRY